MILVCICLFYIINNIIWLFLNEAGLIYDSLNHFLLSIKIFDWIKEGNFPWLSDVILYIFPQQRWHGVLVAYLVAPFYFILGKSENVGVFVNGSVFSGILIFSVYGICKKMHQDRKTGILAAFIVTMYPLIFTHSRTFELDLPLTAMVTLSIYMLLLSDYFSKKKYSVLFGIVSGLGMLTKFNFIGFLAPLILLTYFRWRKGKWSNILISLSIISVLSAKFYMLKSQEILYRIYETSWVYMSTYYNQSQRLASAWLKTCAEYISWLAGDIINNSVTFLFIAIFLIALTTFAKSRTKDKVILYLWLLPPILFLSLFFHKPLISRYIMPILPAMAIISAIGINSIQHTRIRKAVVYSMMILGCFQYIALSYNLNFLPEKIDFKKIALFNRSINLVHRNTIFPFAYPSRISWEENEILEAVRINPGIWQNNLFFADAVPEVYSPLISKTAIEEIPLGVFFIPLRNEIANFKGVDPFFWLSLADYVVIKKDNLKSTMWENRIPMKESVKEEIAATRKIFYAYSDRFELIKEIMLPDPDDTTLQLYKKKSNPIRLLAEGLVISMRDGLVRVIYADKGIEIPLSIFTEFSYSNKRYNSFQAEWNAKVVNNEIIATGIFKDLPLVQECSLKLMGSNVIQWKINIYANDGQPISNAQSQITVACPYKKQVVLDNFRQIKLDSQRVGKYFYPQLILQSFGDKQKFVFIEQNNKFVTRFNLLNPQTASFLILEGKIKIKSG